jgi:hypothetical protein
VRRQWLLQFSGHAGRAEREMGGGVGSGMPRGRGIEGERGGRRGVNSRTTTEVGWQTGEGSGAWHDVADRWG